MEDEKIKKDKIQLKVLKNMEDKSNKILKMLLVQSIDNVKGKNKSG